MNIPTLISGTIVACTLIGSMTYYNYQELQAMKSNIESAIVKGIDPVAVKCAYSSTNANAICVAYAASKAGK